MVIIYLSSNHKKFFKNDFFLSIIQNLCAVCNVHQLRERALTERFSALQIFDPPIKLLRNLSPTMENPTGLFSLRQAFKCIYYMYSVNVLVFVLKPCAPS